MKTIIMTSFIDPLRQNVERDFYWPDGILYGKDASLCSAFWSYFNTRIVVVHYSYSEIIFIHV